MVWIFVGSLLLFFLLFSSIFSRATERRQGQADTPGELLHIGGLVALIVMLIGLGVTVCWMNRIGFL